MTNLLEAKDVTFGIEIEVTIPVQNWPFSVGTYHRGTQVPVYPLGWNSQADRSVYSDTGFIPLEIVSPKLKGEQGLVEVVQVLTDLKERGAVMNASTGLHIHVDGRNLDQEAVDRVTTLFKRYEKLFFASQGDKGQGRYNNDMCKNSTFWVDGQENTDRYRSLNLVNYHNLARKKTIEFRLFSGELELEKVVTYIYMCVGLVCRANNAPLGQHTTLSTVKSLCRSFVQTIFRKKGYQIVPDYTPKNGDSLYQSLYDGVEDCSILV